MIRPHNFTCSGQPTIFARGKKRDIASNDTFRYDFTFDFKGASELGSLDGPLAYHKSNIASLLIH